MATRNDLPALDKAARDFEQSIKRKAVRLLAGSTFAKERTGKENVNESNMDSDYDDRSCPSRDESMCRDDLSFAPNDLTMATIYPREKTKKLKVNNLASYRSNASSAHSSGKQREAPGVNQLLAAVDRSPEIGKMLVNPYVLIVVSSVVHQNLG